MGNRTPETSKGAETKPIGTRKDENPMRKNPAHHAPPKEKNQRNPRQLPPPTLPNKYMTPLSKDPLLTFRKASKAPAALKQALTSVDNSVNSEKERKRVISPFKCLICAALIILLAVPLGIAPWGWSIAAATSLIGLGTSRWKQQKDHVYVWTRAGIPDSKRSWMLHPVNTLGVRERFFSTSKTLMHKHTVLDLLTDFSLIITLPTCTSDSIPIPMHIMHTGYDVCTIIYIIAYII